MSFINQETGTLLPVFQFLSFTLIIVNLTCLAHKFKGILEHLNFGDKIVIITKTSRC